jgi:hypothetical protein
MSSCNGSGNAGRVCLKCRACADGEFIQKQCNGSSFSASDRDCLACPWCNTTHPTMVNGCDGTTFNNTR